jgi:hypothetical protein
MELRAESRGHSLARPREMGMAERHGQGVGGIGGLWPRAQAELSAHHLLHLLFGRATIAGHAGFDFARRIAVRGDASLGCGEQDDAAHLG